MNLNNKELEKTLDFISDFLVNLDKVTYSVFISYIEILREQSRSK